MPKSSQKPESPYISNQILLSFEHFVNFIIRLVRLFPPELDVRIKMLKKPQTTHYYYGVFGPLNHKYNVAVQKPCIIQLQFFLSYKYKLVYFSCNFIFIKLCKVIEHGNFKNCLSLLHNVNSSSQSVHFELFILIRRP